MFRDISSIKDLINAHESDKVEFKQSFRWSHYTGKIDKSIPIKVTRVTSSFLNTDGGILIIGIEDDGKIIGVKKDIETYNKNVQKGKDLFLTDIGEKIRKNISVSANFHCKLSFKTIESKEILIINIKKSIQPYFHLKNEFYIRSQNATTKLSKEETYDYFKHKFNIELSKKNLEYLFFTLLGYLRLLKNVILEKIGFYFALFLLSVSYYFIWYISLFIDYTSSIRFFPFQFILITLFLLGLTIDLSRIYRKLKKSEETTQKTFKNYIPQVNKRIMIIVLISFVVFSALSFISFLIVFPIITSNLIEAIIYFSQYVLILTSFIILYRNIRKFPDFNTNLLDEKEFLD